MKNKVKEKTKMNIFKHKDEIKEELKSNSIVLSFAISIIIIGFISIFYKTSNTLLLGIAISSLLLTLIQCFSNGNTILNIFPIFTLLLFGFFQGSIENIPMIRVLLKDHYTNFIIFLAFSLTFLTQAYKNILYKYEIKEANIHYNEEKNKMIYANLERIKNIKEKAVKIKKVVEEKSLNNESLNRAMKDLAEYVEDETFISNVKSTLITKGSEDKKVTFNIEEIEESITLNNKLIRNREINAVNHKEEL